MTLGFSIFTLSPYDETEFHILEVIDGVFYPNGFQVLECMVDGF